MIKKKRLLALTSCVLAAIVTFGIAGCDNDDSSSTQDPSSTQQPFVPVDTEHYNYNRFDDEANFNLKGVDDSDWAGVKSTAVTEGYEKGSALAPQTSTYVRTLNKSEIVKPVAGVVDEHETYGVSAYPSYGKSLKGYTVEERNGIIRESRALTPSPTWKSLGIYNGIDSEGYLLKNGQRVKYADSATSNPDDNEESEGEIISGGDTGEDEEEEEIVGSAIVNTQYNQEYRKLYKHTAAVTHFGGGLSDDEPRIVKTITAVTHTKLASTQITGLYAPAGEVIRIDMSESDYRAAGGLCVYIGQNYNLDQQVSMETTGSGIKGNGFTRMSDILNKFALNDASKNVTVNDDGTVTAYVGSFLGGPIYFRSININSSRKISVTFSGAVRYQHFILGATTKEEYEENAKSTAPYFDLEVYDSVRFTTARYDAFKKMTYENCTDGAILWDKIAEVSTRVAANGLSASSAPVYIIGDCYIAAGAAFANPGRNGVVCPPGWLAGALNYNSFVNGGEWGTMHEYNHCWQGYGVGSGGEVTNNATTLVSYTLYTRISQSRTATGSPGGWNRFTDPAKAMTELLTLSSGGGKRYDLSLYATLIHNIGQDNFVAAARGGREAGSTVYYRNVSNASQYDMTYYFTKVLNFGVAETLGGEGNPGKIGNLQKSVVDEIKAKNYPMFVPVSSVYQVGRSIIYNGEKRYITTAQPFSYGTGEYVMDFNDRNNFKENSVVSKGLVIPDGFTAKVVSVSQPANGKVELLENNYVKYTPKDGSDGLYSGNFRVKLRITKDDGEFIVEDVDLVINLRQSSDTKLNRTTYVYDDASKVPAVNSVYNAETKSFNFGEYAEAATRKNVCTQETNTQIWGAGRTYLGDTYNADSYEELPIGRTIQTLDGVMYFSGAGTYRFTLKGRGKATLYLSYDNGATWESAVTIDRSSGNSYDSNVYSQHEFTTTNNYVHFKVVLLVKNNWQDFFGIGVAAQKADGSFPAFENAGGAITNASIELDKISRAESAKKFETEYHFKNEYKYSYTNEDKIWAAGNKLVSVSHGSWDDSLKIGNLFDGNTNTYYHSARGEANYITAEKPLELVVDLGSVRTVNRVAFNGFNGKIGNNGMVKDFKIYGSTDGVNFDTLVTEVTDSPANAKNMTFSFDSVKIRYYKLIVTKTDNNHYFAMCNILFSNYVSFADGSLVAPNEFGVRYIGDSWSTKNVLSNFGIIYTANAKDSVEFHFTGSRFAYLAQKSADYGTVDIYVDGKLVAENVDLSSANNENSDSGIYDRYNLKVSEGSLAYMYTGDALASGVQHTIKVVGKSGKFNVDSFVYWA